MAVMSRRKPKPEPLPPEDPKNGSGRSGVNINVWVDEELGRTFLRYLEVTEPTPTKTSAIEHALRLLLRAVGMWPPARKED